METVTVSRKEAFTKWDWALTVTWAILLVWYTIILVVSIVEGDVGKAIFYVFLVAFAVLMGLLNWNGTMWRAWLNKVGHSIHADQIAASYLAGQGNHSEALAVLNRHADYKRPSFWSMIFTPLPKQYRTK